MCDRCVTEDYCSESIVGYLKGHGPGTPDHGPCTLEHSSHGMVDSLGARYNLTLSLQFWLSRYDTHAVTKTWREKYAETFKVTFL